MNQLSPKPPKELIHDIIVPQGYFPNNSRFPLVIYKEVFNFSNPSLEGVQQLLANNHWLNSWVDSIYDFHHYHSNTHETLVIVEGRCTVQIGGDKGKKYAIGKNDVIIFPAGVSHKNVGSSSDFKCIGAYPADIAYDMKHGTAEEHPEVDSTIQNVKLPKSEPIFGKKGLLFNYWK